MFSLPSLRVTLFLCLSADSCSAYVHCLHCLLPVPYLMGTVRCFVCPLTRIIIHNNNWDNNNNNNSNIRGNNKNSLLHALVASKDCATTLAISVIAARVTRRSIWPVDTNRQHRTGRILHAPYLADDIRGTPAKVVFCALAERRCWYYTYTSTCICTIYITSKHLGQSRRCLI